MSEAEPGVWEDDDLDLEDRPKRKRHDGSWDDPVKQAKFRHAADLIGMGADPNGEKVAKLLREASHHRHQNSRLQSLRWPDRGGTSRMAPVHDLPELRPRRRSRWRRAAGRLRSRRLYLAAALPKRGGVAGRRRRNILAESWGRNISDGFKTGWADFLLEHRDWLLERAVSHLESLQRKFEEERSRRAAAASARKRRKNGKRGGRKV